MLRAARGPKQPRRPERDASAAIRRETPGLLRLARRCTRTRAEAEDTVQSALLAAVAAERADLEEGRNLRWVRGAIVKIGAMTARSAVRRRTREQAFAELRAAPAAFTPLGGAAQLSPALDLTARLAAAGCTRAELRWLLGISDAALRQRIAALRRSLARSPGAAREAPAIVEAAPIRDGLRQALLPAARRARAAVLASHDPDGHLFVAAASRIAASRQHGAGKQKGES